MCDGRGRKTRLVEEYENFDAMIEAARRVVERWEQSESGEPDVERTAEEHSVGPSTDRRAEGGLEQT